MSVTSYADVAVGDVSATTLTDSDGRYILCGLAVVTGRSDLGVGLTELS